MSCEGSSSTMETTDDKMQLLHVSFAREDLDVLCTYYDVISEKCGVQAGLNVKMAGLLNQSVDDFTWFDRWLLQLVRAHGIVIIKSKKYMEKVSKNVKTSALAREAQAIMFRMKLDPDFRVYVLDPEAFHNGPNDLRCWLMDNETRMNAEGWNKKLNNLGVEIGAVAISNTLAQYVREGKVNEKQKFADIAKHLQGHTDAVSPGDALVLLKPSEDFQDHHMRQLCEQTIKKHFSNLNFDDLKLIPNHQHFLSVLDSDDLVANEDQVFDVIFQYVMNCSELCTDLASMAWRCCRFAFVSSSKLETLSTMKDVPCHEVVLAFARRTCQNVQEVEEFLDRRRSEAPLTVMRFSPRTSQVSIAACSQPQGQNLHGTIKRCDDECARRALETCYTAAKSHADFDTETYVAPALSADFSGPYWKNESVHHMRMF